MGGLYCVLRYITFSGVACWLLGFHGVGALIQIHPGSVYSSSPAPIIHLILPAFSVSYDLFFFSSICPCDRPPHDFDTTLTTRLSLLNP
ncbi:hypothetical protein GGR58DRAFT_377289 [Xylaria digitata]|nr:hypothetical protein GGR58DRAFT_377289 [Xylaria digitata]